MKLHANAPFGPKGRLTMVTRVIEQRWSLAEAAEAADHHPDLDIRYRKVRVALSTHDAGGLTDMDFDLAGEIEATATPGAGSPW